MLYITGIIGVDVSNKDILNYLSKSTGDIDVLISSDGGVIDEALLMYDTLESYKKKGNKINVRLVGTVASAASFLAMVGDSITATASSQMMVHCGRIQPQSHMTASDMDKMAETIRKYDNMIVNIYNAKTGIDKDSIAAMMKAETYMTATEMKEMGFATDVEEMRAVAMLSDKAFNTNQDNYLTEIKNELMNLKESILAVFNGKKVLNLKTTLEDGTAIFIDSEEATPKVGDKVYLGETAEGEVAPDGEHTLTEFMVIAVVAGGEITELKPIEEEVVTETDVTALLEEITNLRKELGKVKASAIESVSMLADKVEVLNTSNAELTKFKKNYELGKLKDAGKPNPTEGMEMPKSLMYLQNLKSTK